MTDKEFQEFMIKHLSTLTEGQASLGNRMDNMVTRMDKLDSQMSKLDTRMDSLDSQMGKLELRLENEAFSPIRILSENVLDLTNRQSATEENMKFLVTSMDHVVTIVDDHTQHLERIEAKLETHDIQIHVLDKTKSNKRKVK